VVEPGLEIPRKDIADFCRQHRIKRLAVFGSAVRKDFRYTSDVDLLVEFEPDAQVGFIALSRLQRELSAIFGRQVDLVPRNGLKPKIRDAVLSSAEELYAA